MSNSTQTPPAISTGLNARFLSLNGSSLRWRRPAYNNVMLIKRSIRESLPSPHPPRVLIAGEFGFPHGTGGSARVHTYAQGLSAAGLAVEVVCLRPSESGLKDALNFSASGIWRGIPFVYSGGSPYRDDTFARRRLRDARSALRLRQLVRGDSSQTPANVILFSNSAAWILTTVLACRVAGSACVIEKSEYPFVNAPHTAIMKVRSWLFTRTLYRLVDGVIVISTCLEKYFLARVRRGAEVIRIPILVDLEEFSEERIGDGVGQKILCYVGSLDHEGEVDRLVEAFYKIEACFPEWSLRVIGGGQDPSILASFRSRVAERGMADRIEFVGKVGRDDLPRLFREVGAFALPRARGLFSTAGFPTKLGEYLASGRPVIVTATGDIPLFVRDGVDAFLVPPDDPGAFAARLTDMFADPVAAHSIGLRGRETARQHFDVEFQCRRLATFLTGLGDGA
jgi:glycosyltransferase involved in cell wall biosynthesis